MIEWCTKHLIHNYKSCAWYFVVQNNCSASDVFDSVPQEDNVDKGAVESLVDAFPGQSIDFFGALRARVYDDKVRDFVKDIGVENMGDRLVNSREGKVSFEKPEMKYDVLFDYGNLLVQEQDNVRRVQLADSYLENADLAGTQGTSLPEAVL